MRLTDILSLSSALFTHQWPRTPTYRIVPPRSPPLTSTALSDVTQLSGYDFLKDQPSDISNEPRPSVEQQPDDVPFIPGGGLTRRILSSLPADWSIPTACLLQFVLEGDNRTDATFLAGVVAKLLNFDSSISEWKQPASWKDGLFGTPHDDTLFG